MTFADQVIAAHEPRYVSQYYADYRRQYDDYSERMRRANEIARQQEQQRNADWQAFNERQKWRPSAAEANQSFAPQWSQHDLDAIRIGNSITPEMAQQIGQSVWGDQINGGSMSPFEFQSLEDRLIGGGGQPNGSGSATSGGSQQVTAVLRPHTPMASFDSPEREMGPAGQMAAEGAARSIGGGMLPIAPIQTQPNYISGGTGEPLLDRLSHTVSSLSDNHPDKAAYSQVLQQLHAGNVHAIPQALQTPPRVSTAFGNAVQAQNDATDKKAAQAASMIRDMSHDGKHGFEQIAGMWNQFKQQFPEHAQFHIKGMTDSQFAQWQTKIQEEEVRGLVDQWNKQLPAGTMPMPRENYRGKDIKGKDQWMMTPSEWVAMQREQGTTSHQKVMEGQSQSQADQKHKTDMFHEEIKMANSLMPKPLPEGAGAKQRAAHDRKLQIAQDMLGDTMDRWKNNGEPMAARMPQSYKDAQAEETAAAGAAAEQASGAKQAVQQAQVAHLQTQDQQGAARIDLTKVQQELTKAGIALKGKQLEQVTQKMQRETDHDKAIDAQHVAAFAELQKKNLNQQQNAQVGQMLRAIAMKKPAPLDAITAMFAETPDDQITDKNRDQVSAAKLAAELSKKERATYNDSVDLILNHAKSMVGTNKPAAAAPIAVTSADEMKQLIKTKKVKVGDIIKFPTGVTRPLTDVDMKAP